MHNDVPKDIAHMPEIQETPPCAYCGAQDRRFCRMKLCAWPLEIQIDKDEKGEYCLYSEANAIIGDLRKRLERANLRYQRRNQEDFQTFGRNFGRRL